MRQAGVSTAARRERRARPAVDFGVDGTWEAAPPRRLRVATPAEVEVVPASPLAEVATIDIPAAQEQAFALRDPDPRPASSAAGRSAARTGGAPSSATGGSAGRRTVTIRGRGAERDLAFPAPGSRRPATRVHERPGFKPDRTAMWAVLLGVVLVLVAAMSAHGATVASAVRQAHAARTPPALVRVVPGDTARTGSLRPPPSRTARPGR